MALAFALINVELVTKVELLKELGKIEKVEEGCSVYDVMAKA